MTPSIAGALFVLLGSLFWSTGGMCIKLLEGYEPMGVSAGRSILAAALFLVLAKFRVAPGSRHGRAVVLGAVAYFAVVTSFVYANRMTSAANAILLQSAAPLWVALWTWRRGVEKPLPAELAALVLGGVGLAACVFGGTTNTSAVATNPRLGDALSLASGMAFAVLIITLRSLSASTKGAPGDGTLASIQVLFWGNLLAGLAGLPSLLPDLGTPAIPGHGLLAGLLVLAWLGFGQLGGGYIAFQRGIRTMPALTASLLALVEPILNPLWVWLFVGEAPHMGTRVGGGLVLAACALTVVARHRAAGREPAPTASPD